MKRASCCGIIVIILLMCIAAAPPAPGARPGRSPATRPTTTRSPHAWPELTPEQRKAALEENKQKAENALNRAGIKLSPYETEYFVFLSNLPRSEAAKWAGLLDQYYSRLAVLFGIPKGENLWRGKAVIYVFALRSEYETFEDKAYHDM